MQHRFMKQFIYTTLLAMSISLYGTSSPLSVAAQTQTDSSVTSPTSSQSETSLETGTQASNSKAAYSVSKYLPYGQFYNYQYAGNGLNAGTREVITEYPIDGNGRYQITILEVGKATIAYVYELRADGLYELACFEDYTDVKDLRYSPETEDGVYSQLLPADLSVGTTYKNGYQDDHQRTIMATNMQYTINNVAYSNVLKIKDVSASGTIYLYYAPISGLIAVEDSSENVLYALTATYGSAH